MGRNNISYLIKLPSFFQFGPLSSKYARFLYTKPYLNMLPVKISKDIVAQSRCDIFNASTAVFMSESIPTGYVPSGNPQGLAQKTCPWGRDLAFENESCPGAGNSTRAGILWKMKLKLQKNSVDQIITGENKKNT